MRYLVWLVMSYACEWTGHRAWYCYNEAPERLKRLWYWSWGFDR